MSTEPKDTVTWYLRMFSYLLVICGLFGFVAGGVVIYQAFVDGAPQESSLSLGSVAIGLASAAAYGVTIAAGLWAHATSHEAARAGSLYTLSLAGIVATVLGLGLCYATGAGMPTTLLFNGLLMVICSVIAANLRKSPPRDGDIY